MKEDEIIAGYPITTKTAGECIADMVGWINSGLKGKWLVCANPHSLEVARKDPGFDLAIRSADLLVPDGIGIVIASWILGGGIRTRITGTDIFLALSSALNREKRYGYFFLGSTDENLRKIEEKMSRDFPNISVTGTYAPPFKPEFSDADNRAMVHAINAARPDVLWVGMTAPKQEKWIEQNKDKLNVKFIGAIGAVFDFYTGKVKRSHPLFQRMGLEWLPRLIRQPHRLWKRNFISNPRFLLRVINSRTSGSTGK
jgi:N-acetylglucosaminyldiphosphoundecaprenol N-acetyl-beta-D-mannosaminyltransferase